MSDAARSVDWIKAEYDNQKAPGAFASRTVASGGTPDYYASWASNYPGMNLSDPKASNHGLTNQQLFAFGLDPTSAKSVNPISGPFNKATGTFSYTRNASSGLSYTVWTSPNLTDWTQDPTATSGQSVTSTASGIQTVAVTVSTAAVSGKLFVRVQAQ